MDDKHMKHVHCYCVTFGQSFLLKQCNKDDCSNLVCKDHPYKGSYESKTMHVLCPEHNDCKQYD